MNTKRWAALFPRPAMVAIHWTIGVGRSREERALLAFAHAFEQAVSCRGRKPPWLALR